MKKQQLLRQFEFRIPASALAAAGVKQKYIVPGHLPLMKVAIDFENGELRLEGDWNFMMAVNGHNKKRWGRHHRERVNIATRIFPASPVNLSDDNSDGLMCPLKGNIKDGGCIADCNGLLILDNVRRSNGSIGNHWDICFYIYDSLFGYNEIKFRLPLYTNTENSNFN